MARLPVWLALVMKVVVVGGFAFGCGFLGVVAARSFGWVLAGHADGALATVAPVLV